VYIFDALREGVLDTLRPVLCSSSITKVMHDCREDASAMLTQQQVELAGVFDSQVAHTMLLRQEDARPFQISLNELLKNTLQLQNEQQLFLTEKMKGDPNVWFYRPMEQELLNYAAQDVMYLPLLHRLLCEKLRDPSGGRVLAQSRSYVEYSRMNLHLNSPKAAEKRGLRLQAMLATRTEKAIYFKLNLGAQRQGAVSRPEAVSRFRDMEFGDIADCWVSAWNVTGSLLFLERLEAGTAALKVPAPPPDPGTSRYYRRRRGI
jgi:exonuclease 3'-5' domain-containing protein 1